MINENIETAKADANAKVITDTDKTQASFMEAREMTIESVFGVKAGIVWGALNQNGPSTIGDIVQARSLRREKSMVPWGGWAARTRSLWSGTEEHWYSHCDHRNDPVIAGSILNMLFYLWNSKVNCFCWITTPYS